jgi:hypothetical protein
MNLVPTGMEFPETASLRLMTPAAVQKTAGERREPAACAGFLLSARHEGGGI